MGIDISVIAVAHRIQHWLECYESYITKLNFEVIFVTDRAPNFTLPDNFRYIMTNVKPAQCGQIAFDEAKGEVVLLTSDDIIFNSYAFDRAYEIYKKHDYKTMVGFRVWEGWGSLGETTDFHYLFHRTKYGEEHPELIKNSPKMLAMGLMSKQLLNEIGRIDNRFVCGQWENDLVMRAYAIGGKIVMSEWSKSYNDTNKHHGEGNYRGEIHKYETELLAKLWVKDNKFSKERLEPVQEISPNNILVYSQGGNIPEKWT